MPEIRETIRQKASGGGTLPDELEFGYLLDKWPTAVYIFDASGLITYFNGHAEELWGRAPKLRDPEDRYCGSFKLFSPQGVPIPHDDCWMALALKEKREYVNQEIVVERYNGERVTDLAHASPLQRRSGDLLGAINLGLWSSPRIAARPSSQVSLVAETPNTRVSTITKIRCRRADLARRGTSLD